MKNLLLTLITLFITLTAPAATGPVRVLFLGHENNKVHNSSAAAALLMQECGRDAIYFDFFTQPTCLNPETLARYDAVMLYANHDKITPDQFKALITFIESGGGFLPVHCGSACFGNEPRFAALVGARFKSHGAGVFKASIVDKAHPIMKGVAEYETWDESYVHDQHNPLGRKLLAEREREPWTWVREQGKGRVFYTASGHDNRTWSNANFQLLLRNAILWAIGDTRRVQWQAFVTQREPEKRERNPNVANYENRSEPITFQRPFTVKGSMERTQVPAGLHLELFAAEPNIAKPIALAWDERGRCWVAETGDYPHDVAPNGVGHDRIKICEDTNGDGRADKFTVFAEKLNIPTSLVLVNGGVIVAQPPRFLFLKDTNGDDKADVRQVIMEGWGIGDTHAQANNLHYGYDNWLHGCVGYSGFKGQVDGKPLAFTQGTYRFKTDGSELEFLHQFSNNSWGQSQNAAGDDFGGTANNAPIFYGGIPARVTPPGMRLMTAKRINVEGKVHAITPNYRQVDVFGGYTSAAGSAFIYSANLPPWLQGMAMVTEPTMKVVSLMDVQPQGAGYVANDGFNLLASSDEWLSPVFAEVGPDGAVWVADWQNFIIQHNPTPSRQRGGFDGRTGVGGAHENPLRDHARGRIYRVVWDQARPPAIRSLKGAPIADLVRALGSDTQFWRLTAQRLLVEGRKLDAAPSLKSVVSGNSGHVGVIHALWTLHGLGALDPVTHKAALEAKDPALRRNAIRALGTSADTAALFLSTKVAADPDPITRLAALVKLAEFPPSPSWTSLVEQLRNDPVVSGDEWLREAFKVVEQKHARPGGATPAEAPLAGDVKRGELVFYKHPAAACVLCHTLRGQGSTVGPALDHIASRFPAAYINESLLEPGKVLAKGFEALGASPMPPLGLVLKPQELEDVKAFLMTLK